MAICWESCLLESSTARIGWGERGAGAEECEQTEQGDTAVSTWISQNRNQGRITFGLDMDFLTFMQLLWNIDLVLVYNLEVI